jgi:CheY-like chemotaxis protein
MLRSFLEQEGCSVGIAEDGLGAVELRASGGYDAIIMDCHMPVMDGFQATRQIRNMEREFDWPAIPIIALSGHVGPKDRDRCLKAGMNAHLAKPIDLTALKRALLSEICQEPAGREVVETSRAVSVEAVVSPAPEVNGRTLFANPSVLVAEDCEVNCEVATALLEMMGCSVTVARNGKVAVDLCSRTAFDMVLMDVQMPEMDGLEAAGKLREMMRSGAMGRTPVIAFTANALKGDREKCLEAGMDDYIEKPIDQRVMAEKLRKWLPPHLHAEASAESWVPIDEATLNPAALRAVRNMMKGRFESYIRMFVRETRRQLDLIRQAVSGGGTVEDVAGASGALRQACSQVGATRLSYVAGIVQDMALEIRSRGGDLGGIRDQADRLETLFAELEAEIQRHLKTDWAQKVS